jgi:XTP/dITP diphosphohydrolase
MERLLIASNNAGKVEEFRELLHGCGWEIVAPSDLGLSLEVEETGRTYEENSLIKARAFAEASGLPALADDSGLEVDALNGEPGPLHHENGWDGADQAERIAILLRALKDVPADKRSCRFKSVIVLVRGDQVLDAHGQCEGVIIESPHGSNGHGYDPVFFVPERGSTMAQLTTAEKNEVSHRGMAARKMRSLLQDLANEGGR